MADIMELDDSFVEKTDEVVMPPPIYDEKNKPWCLDCSLEAGEPARAPCNHPEDEATRTFKSTSENDRRRTCRRIHTLARQMDYLFHQTLRQMPRNLSDSQVQQKPPYFLVTREIKIKLLVSLLYTNQIGGQDDRSKRALDVRKYMTSDEKPSLAVGIDSLGLWVRLDTELDAEPDYQRLVPHDVVTNAISSHSTEA
ncbi:hypothetical protein BM221_008383 [Beauveria bassiana]|uniref:Uncharacterized protein n=1 Tax=Beauveria bassiana TaxID=176275 RepID=A0A2N6NG02_BEABA|nr:hypothetical protein BM221_008383 [Beauveria bassiana]